MPLENIDLDGPIAAEPLSASLDEAIRHSIDVNGLHAVRAHIESGLDLGHSLDATAEAVHRAIADQF